MGSDPVDSCIYRGGHHGHDGKGTGTWSKFCLQEIMLVQTVLGFTPEKEGRSYPRTKPHHGPVHQEGRGGSAGLSAEALGFQCACNGETNGHI